MSSEASLRQLALGFACQVQSPSISQNTEDVLKRADKYFEFLAKADPKRLLLLKALNDILRVAASDSRDKDADMVKLAQAAIIAERAE